MSRIEMPPNYYSLRQQIINHVTDVDFNEFLKKNPGAKEYYESLDEVQKWQYTEDFWYCVNLIQAFAQPLVKIAFPEHKK